MEGEENSECGPDRTGTYTYSTATGVALEWVIDYLHEHKGDNLYPRVLIGSTDQFVTDNYEQQWSDRPAVGSTVRGETERVKTLRVLINVGARVEIVRGSADDYLDFIRHHFERILIPYCKSGNHFLLFELRLRKDRPCALRVWDSWNSWATTSPARVKEVVVLLNGFFRPGDLVRVKINRAGEDPDQGGTHACVAFTFFSAVHRALGKLPPHATGRDEAVLRNYLCGCIIKNRLLPLPMRC